MKKRSLPFLSMVCLLLTACFGLKAQSIYTYSNATNGAYSFLAPNLTASTLATVGSWGSNTPCSNGAGISGITTDPSYSTYNPANTNSPALNVNITPAAGYMIKVTSVSVSMRRSGTGPTKARLAYSIDNGLTWVNNGSDLSPNNGSCGSFSSYNWVLSAPQYVCSNMLKARVYYFAASQSSGTCQTANLVVSGTVTPIPVPSLIITASPATPVCAGANVTFTAAAVNPGAAPTYTWKKNGSVVGSNSTAYSDNTLTASDIITCELNSNAPCASTAAVSSNTVSVAVYPAVTNDVADTVCFGETASWGAQTLSTTGIYTQTFTTTHGCDSTVTMHFFVRPAITHTFYDTACYGDIYSWYSLSPAATGSYTQAFPSYTGCDSTVTLHLFIRPGITHAFADTICAGTTYSWYSLSPTATGSYAQTFPSYTGCDSNVTLHLFVRAAITHSFADTICATGTYSWAGQSFTTTGTYNHTFTSYTGCDSVVTLHLFARPAITYAFADTICALAGYNWGGQSFTTTGTYSHTFTSYTGCDSTVTLHLFVRPAIAYAFADTVCASGTYIWAGQSFATTGTYNHTFTSYTGCDSVVTLHLYVRPVNANTISQSICAGSTYMFGAQVLNISGTYNHTFQAANGCDSVVTLVLTVNPVTNDTFTATTCSGVPYNWASQFYTASGYYTNNFISVAGCDSTVTLNLTVSPQIIKNITDTICYGTTYTLGTQTLNASGIYTHIFTAVSGCDSTVTLNLTVRPQDTKNVAASICSGEYYVFGTQTLSASGSYTEVFTSVHGCDSTVHLSLDVSPAPVSKIIDTAACGSLVFENVLYTSSTTLADTFHNAKGCDSAYRKVNVVVHNNDATILTIDSMGCNSVVFEGRVYTTSTAFSDTFHNALGCDSVIRRIRITVGASGSYEVDKAICQGDTFRFDGQPFTATGKYSLRYKNVQGCDSVIQLNLTVNPLPDVQLSAEEPMLHCIRDSVVLNASGASTYVLTGGFGSRSGHELQVLLPDLRNVISVEGTDVNGCRDTASIVIDAQHCCNIWMPNAFSPNGDNLNDVFRPESKGHPLEYLMKIYDRWGHNVYTSFKVEEGWDGTINGQPAPVATYHYVIGGKCTNGEPVSLKGALTLVR